MTAGWDPKTCTGSQAAYAASPIPCRRRAPRGGLPDSDCRHSGRPHACGVPAPRLLPVYREESAEEAARAVPRVVGQGLEDRSSPGILILLERTVSEFLQVVADLLPGG